jgi:glycosyltransferase involved in cell wall biosynthesis
MRITICIPCYNSEKWVKQAVESALLQDYKNLEVIAVDNESKDNTLSILNSLKKQYPSLIVETAPNIYRHSWDEARERSLEIFTGDYITFMCSDDYLEPNYVSNMVELINKAPNSIKAIQSPIRNITNSVPTGFQSHFYKSINELKDLLLSKSVVNTPTVFYKRELNEKGLLKAHPEKYFGASDYDLYCRLADNNVFIYPAPSWTGYNYRWHEEQCTWGMHKEPVKYDVLIQQYWKSKWKPT